MKSSPSHIPSRGASEATRTGWVERPLVARLVRGALFLLPIIVGWLAVRFTKQWFWRPDGWTGLVAWVIQAIVVAGLASFLATKAADRFAPLSALFRLTLIFPDHAPSRLGVALRGGTIRKMKAATELSNTSVQAAAEEAVALVAELGRHERLTRGHTERVRAQAELIGAEMGLDDEELQLMRWGMLLHDIGKLRVPAEILNKQERLTDDEWAILKQHPAEGAQIVAPLVEWLGEWVDAASQHHERWDGKGYPLGLSGTEISLSGRIAAVADAYDVITSKRSYKEAMTSDAARQELVRCAGHQFDPAVVRAALAIGLREPKRLGLFSWLAEQPAIANAISSAPTAAAAAAVVVVASFGGGVASTDDQPTTIAMSDAADASGADANVAETDADSSELTDGPVQAETNGPDSTEPEAPEPLVTITTVPGADGSDGSPADQPSTTSTISSPVSDPTTSTTAPTTTTDAAPDAPTTTTSPSTTGTQATPTTTVPDTTTTTAPTTTTTLLATTTTLAPPIPVDAGGTAVVILTGTDVPASVELNALESATITYVFEEKQHVALTTDLTVRAWVDSTNVPGDNPPTTVIPAGTNVCSWFIHHDPPNASDTWDPSIDFGATTVLGLATTRADLEASSELESDLVAYTYAGLEFADRLTILGTNLTLDLAAYDNGRDQLRVITSC